MATPALPCLASNPHPAPQAPCPCCSYEHKPAEVIQKDLGNDYLSRINAALTSVRGVNKTDVKTLGDRWGYCLPACLPPWLCCAQKVCFAQSLRSRFVLCAFAVQRNLSGREPASLLPLLPAPHAPPAGLALLVASSRLLLRSCRPAQA